MVTGLFIVVASVCLVLLGLLVYSGGFTWFGRLPGDIRYRGVHTRVYVPLTSMLLVSSAASLLVYLLSLFL